MIRTQEQHLAHYGILRRSGRYPWGSGSTENIRNKSFLDIIGELRKEGLSESEIARGFGITTTQLRSGKTIALAQQKQQKILTAQRLKEKGWSYVAIGQRMGLNESSVRALCAPGEQDKVNVTRTVSNMIKTHTDKKKMIDVGSGVENQLGITQTRLKIAVAMLREQGYALHSIKIEQLGQPGKFTTMKVLAIPGTTLSYVQKNRSKIKQIMDYSKDGGRSFFSIQKPISINSNRIRINYKEDGGDKADGVIYVRPGVKDLSIGSSRYAQVRISIDGTHYLKGMAIYKEDLPAGADLVFNTNKTKSRSKKDVMKEIEADPDLPFGSIVRQIHGPDGKVSSAMNIVGSPTKEGSGEEGSWDNWSRNLPSQMLSKQNPDLAKQQLDLTYERRRIEFDEINSLTNPTIRKELLTKFADQTDAAAVHLKAANLPRQATKVLLPVPSMKPTEIYAPSMRNGEQVALIRFPHAGTFEIPQLTVNNRNREARKLLGTSAKDAIGVHHKVAEHLSGADFDGDTVLVIPNNKGSIKRTDPLEGLKGFDPQVYKIPKDSPISLMTSARKGQEMGKISNLITDMTLRGANRDELARAVKHSMVVIDAEKHGLDFKQSEKDHGISNLKEKYQGRKNAGASTLISRAKSPVFLPERKERSAAKGGPIDKLTGKKVYEPTGRMIPDRKTGGMVLKEDRHKALAVTDNASDLSYGTRIESLYAGHSNKLKAMANTARKESVYIKPAPYSPSAKKVYVNEVASLNAKLNVSLMNSPRERQAQLIGQTVFSQKKQANPHLEKSEIKKIKQHALNEARIRTGAKKEKISITQSEWDAIQAGAISTDKLVKIFNNSDIDTIRQLALPKHKPKMTSTMQRRAMAMLASGATQAEVADALGVGLTTLKVSISE